MSNHEADSTQDFDARYRLVGEAAMRRAEQRVIGADYGATSYTTVAQADILAELLGLTSGRRLLDVGSGAGWPGIYLARTTGCDVVLTDLPLEGLRAAGRRLRREGASGAVVAASGDALPFRTSAFDAVTSSDALCWLADKLSVLRAGHRLLTPGGRISFAVIAVPAGLTREESARAHQAGPARVDAGDGYAALLHRAGFRDIDVRDVSAAYLATAAAWVREWDAERGELERLLGVEAFAERQSGRRHALGAIAAGLLGRYLFTARRP